ncbi:MAG: hypothetical protein F7B60_04280 [Desulfurococcales archaeon]|nr:hypothetical protein [Desulfurococcales archaeon]
MHGKIVVVTGKLAMEEAERQVELLNKAGYNVKLKVFNIDVAVFINEKNLASWINKFCSDLKGSVIVIPGGSHVRSDIFYTLLRCKDVRVVKGPIHISDLYHYSTAIPLGDWMLDHPVDRLHECEKRSSTMGAYRKMLSESKGLRSVHSNIVIPIKPPPFIPIGELYIDSYFGKYFEDKLGWLINSEFPIIVVGSLRNDSSAVEKAVRTVEKEGFNGILGIDLPPSCKSIRLITNTSAELFLSLNSHAFGKLEECIKAVRNSIMPVIIPSNIRGSRRSKLYSLGRGVKKAGNIGLSRIILDPIISPPYSNANTSVLDALLVSRTVNEKYGKPVLLGLSNYIELVDSDSPGLVFSLVQLAVEAKASLGLFSEESYKTQGVLQEAFLAAAMNSYSAMHKIPPKDIGVNLLVLKSKKRIENNITGRVKVLEREGGEQPIGEWDPTGYVNIIVDYKRRLILTKKKKWKHWIGSTEWRPIIDYLIENNEISRIGHAFYLGRELYKATLALKLNKNYIQDERLFTKNYLKGLEKEEKDFEI